mmetsp:Transcript_93745/g.286850  ORF Transcript_93745/g.286850 Transcript_93745/m.286850 type:complete len:277 (-) Transcript_93745:389-1219(-)
MHVSYRKIRPRWATAARIRWVAGCLQYASSALPLPIFARGRLAKVTAILPKNRSMNCLRHAGALPTTRRITTCAQSAAPCCSEQLCHQMEAPSRTWRPSSRFQSCASGAAASRQARKGGRRCSSGHSRTAVCGRMRTACIRRCHVPWSPRWAARRSPALAWRAAAAARGCRRPPRADRSRCRRGRPRRRGQRPRWPARVAPGAAQPPKTPPPGGQACPRPVAMRPRLPAGAGLAPVRRERQTPTRRSPSETRSATPRRRRTPTWARLRRRQPGHWG